MTGTPDDIAEANPHTVRKGADETGGEFVRFESTMYPAPDADSGAELSHERWGLDNDFEHVHPQQEERFEVLSGDLRVEVEDRTETLTAGEDILLPADVPHRHWNPTAEPIRVVWERHPPLRTAAWAETSYALAQAGKTDEDGLPGVLQTAVLFDEYPNTFPAFAPVRVQKALFSALAPIGRLAGYDATHTREELLRQ